MPSFMYTSSSSASGLYSGWPDLLDEEEVRSISFPLPILTPRRARSRPSNRYNVNKKTLNLERPTHSRLAVPGSYLGAEFTNHDS